MVCVCVVAVFDSDGGGGGGGEVFQVPDVSPPSDISAKWQQR